MQLFSDVSIRSSQGPIVGGTNLPGSTQGPNAGGTNLPGSTQGSNACGTNLPAFTQALKRAMRNDAFAVLHALDYVRCRFEMALTQHRTSVIVVVVLPLQSSVRCVT